ncbi:FAD:protein FMN transferase [Cellulomonas xiejunii]|uniref:FAD:protein FMN transferase n=1 Tax=Cellulomonas xiejunii TaxID=2968083 RepID=A0ABY5KK35_9CELL|nr:FAD:protein FMN transferase [Cellulomonas xiejunii]MCC2320015.1 FAD:protein FMN transferase [Cellulomonas xiejunii]UUI70333.1 FAD:protein FMN transferase [Cellulomonas xiejunii]
MPRAETRFEAIGTLWSIETPTVLADAILDRVHAVVDAYDRVWSRFRADSVVSRMAREGGTHALPAHAAELLDLYDVLEERTGGALTPLVGRSLERLGYDATYHLRPAGAPLPVQRGVRTRDVLRRQVRDQRVLTVTATRPVLLDVGAAGKGQLVDLVAAELRACGVGEYVVDAGGDMLHRGPDAVRVGLQVPGDPGRVLGVVELRDAALCASAVDRRSWGDGLHHVLDARTGVPAHGVVATWVLGERAMVADGLATALFLADPDVLQGVAEHTYVQLRADARARVAIALPGEVFGEVSVLRPA